MVNDTSVKNLLKKLKLHIISYRYISFITFPRKYTYIVYNKKYIAIPSFASASNMFEAITYFKHHYRVECAIDGS